MRGPLSITQCINTHIIRNMVSCTNFILYKNNELLYLRYLIQYKLIKLAYKWLNNELPEGIKR